MFSLVRDVFGSFVRADSKAWTKDEFCDKYERPITEKSKQFGSKQFGKCVLQLSLVCMSGK